MISAHYPVKGKVQWIFRPRFVQNWKLSFAALPAQVISHNPSFTAFFFSKIECDTYLNFSNLKLFCKQWNQMEKLGSSPLTDAKAAELCVCVCVHYNTNSKVISHETLRVGLKTISSFVWWTTEKRDYENWLLRWDFILIFKKPINSSEL